MNKTQTTKSKVLMIMAHPDDEVIFGWPILQSDIYEPEIIFLSTDEINPERKWCSNRFEAAKKICKEFNLIMPSGFPLGSEFYRLKTRNADRAIDLLSFNLNGLRKNIREMILEYKYDAIFSHNPIGEYGHLDHILAHILAMTFGLPVLMTDIFIPTNWTPYNEMPSRYRQTYFRDENLVCTAKNDLDFYAKCEAIYRQFKCWTWNKPPVKECNLYRI